MAESQTIYNYEDKAESLKLSLSEERFAPYLIKAGYNEEHAFNLYLFNARLSKAFLFPLHILEVSLRNRIHGIFQEDFGSEWPNEDKFRLNLSEPSLQSLETAIERATTSKTEDIVATLSFDFWSNLFRAEYDRCFWQTQMSKLLPNKPLTRKEFQKHVKDINIFRNRIAHYEPIHHKNITQIHRLILDMHKWICLETADWVKHHSTVNAILRSSPSPTSESRPHFGERCDTSFEIVHDTTTLDNTFNRQFILLKNSNEEIICIIERKHFFDFLMANVDVDGKSLVLDLAAYTYADIFNQCIHNCNFRSCAHTESLSKARDILKQSRADYILVYDTSDVVGVIAKAHRRY